MEWAKDNGRGGEFIKKRKYTKTKYCFECGVCLLIGFHCSKWDIHLTSVRAMFWEIVRNQRRSSEMWKKRARILRHGLQMMTMTIWEEQHLYFSCNLKVFVLKLMTEKSILVVLLAVFLVLCVYLRVYCFQRNLYCRLLYRAEDNSMVMFIKETPVLFMEHPYF